MANGDQPGNALALVLAAGGVELAEEGKLLDSIEIAKELAEKGITPGQYCYELLKKGKKRLPDFYSSDLKSELRRILDKQSRHYPEQLTADFIGQFDEKGKNEALRLFKDKLGVLSADNKGKDRKITAYNWRADAPEHKLELDVIAYVVADICNDIKKSSGYLGAISDRSKELQFANETVGQYLYRIITEKPGTSIRNTTFYRQDYIDEFETIWQKQSEYHKELTPELKKQIRDEIIFYQRRLKSQKALVSNCEFEKYHKAAPKSSPVFQEFRIWHKLNNITVTDKNTGEKRPLSLDEMNRLAEELSIKAGLSDKEVIHVLFGKKKGYELNFKKIEGNVTIAAIAAQLLEVVNVIDDKEYDMAKLPSEDIRLIITSCFKAHGFNENVLSEETTKKLWHLLYSYEGDNSRTGDESLIRLLSQICAFPEEYAQILSSVTFEDEYGSLSSRAMKKILPYLKEGNIYDKACLYAGTTTLIRRLRKKGMRKSL